MLGSFKKFFAAQGLGTDWSAMSGWAEGRGYSFKRVRDDDGFVVEASVAERPCRVEYGPSQREYIHGRELRLRGELGLPADLQMLLMSVGLVEALERKTFEQSTENMQTQIDTSTPEEMRWLVMFQRVNLTASKVLRPLFSAVAASPQTCASWLEGPLTAALERSAARLLNGKPPFVLMTHRGNLYLRLQAPEVDTALLDEIVGLFDTAAAAALRVAGGRAALPANTGRPTTPGSDWPR